jgi:putative DNA primase/helicase
VVLVAHDSLFHGKPSAIGELGWLVVDESFWQSGLRGADGRPVAVTIDSLGASAYCRHHGGGWDMESSRALEAARGSLSAALRSHGNGPVALDALSAAGITADMCRTASSMEWSRKVGTALRPGMTAADRRKAVEAAAENRTIPALARVWDLLADAIEGTHDAAGVEVETVATDDGPLRRLRLRWHAEIRTGWCLPTLHTDATMKVDLVEHYLPRLTLTATCEAVMPNVTIRQVFDRPFSAKMLNPDAVTRDRDKATAQNNLARLHSYIVNRAREYRGRGRNGIDVLVIVQKAIEVRLVAMGLPAGVEIAHHGNVAGIDQWGGVALLVAVGRTSPAPGAVEALATAMTNRPAMPLPDTGAVPWYVKVNRGIRLTDGSVLKVEGDQHPDDVAEAVRWSIVEGGLIQSIGRGRGVNRSAGAPLQVDILTDVVLPLTVIEALTWDDVKPVASDVMMARGAALENSADMAAAFPDLFPSERAANTARQRTDTNAYREASIKANVSVLAAVAYRPAGAGKKLRSAWFDLTMIPNPAAWLTERLGPLASFEFITEPAASTPPVPAGQALSPTQLHKEPIAMTAAAPIMFTVPGLIPATVRAAPVEVAPVAEFRIGRRPVVELPKVAAIGIPGFGVSPDRDPGGVIDGCSDEVPPHRAPFDWGPADAWVEKHRRPPMPPTIPAVPDRATA